METTLDAPRIRPARPRTTSPQSPRLAAPEEAGWEALLLRHRAGLERRIRRIFVRFRIRVRRELIEEVAQEVYCRLLAQGGRRLRQCRAESDEQVASYLARIAERLIIDQIRIYAAAKRGGGRLVALDNTLSAGLAAGKADPSGTPEDRLLARERLASLAALCCRLGRAGSSDGRILRLALFDGWTSREIAHHLGGGLTASGIDSRIHRLRRRCAAVAGLTLPRRQPIPGRRRPRR